MREVLLSADALRQFRRLPKSVQPSRKEAMRAHLEEGDAAETTRNKFRLRRASNVADFELRVGDWRIFYRIDSDCVRVTLVGKKEGNRLIVEGEEFQL